MKYSWFLLLILLIAACARPPQASNSGTQVAEGATTTHTATLLSTFTVTSSPASTTTPLPTNTPTITPSPTNTATPTITPTPTNTPTPELPVALSTPIPQPLHVLSPDNITQITELARYGDGELLEVSLSADEATLFAVFTTGLYTYDVETFAMSRAVQTVITNDGNNSYAFSPDGTYLAVVNGTEIHVWNIADGSLRYTFSMGERPYGVSDLNFAPNSQSLTVVGGLPSGTHLWLWGMSNGELRLHLHNDYIRQAIFWPDDELLVTCCVEFSADAQLWQTTDGSLVDTLVGPPWPDGISSMALSPDESMLAAVYKNSIWLWDTAERQVVQQLNRLNGHGRGGELAFLHEGQVLSMYTYELESLRLWDVTEGTLIADLPNQHLPILSPDHTRLFTKSYDQGFNQLILWALNAYQPVELWRLGENLVEGVFVAGGDFAYVGSNRSSQLLQSSDASVVQTFEGDGERYGFALPDGEMFVTISWAGLNFRNAANGRIQHTIEGQNYFIFPNGRKIVTWDNERIMSWNTTTGQQYLAAELPRPGIAYVWNEQQTGTGLIPAAYLDFLHTLEFPQDSNYWAANGEFRVSYNGAEIEILDVENYSGQGPYDKLYTIPAPNLDGRLIISPDSQLIAAVQNNTRIAVWQAGDGTPVGTISASSSEYVLDFQFSPDSQQIFATTWGSETEQLQVWEISSGNRLFADAYYTRITEGNSSRLCYRRPFALSTAGDLVAYSGSECLIQIVQTNNWRVLQTVDPGIGQSGRLAFSPNGRLLATAFQGGEIKLWDAATGSLIHTILDHISPIDDKPTVEFAFSEDGQLLGTSGNGMLHLWGIWP